MLFKKLAIFMIACVLIVVFGMIQGCSENENPVEPVEVTTDPAETHEPPVVALAAKWDPSGWQNAIILEAKHALSRRNNGTSGVILYSGGAYYGGDWDYIRDPGGASALAAMRRHYSSAQIARYGLWREDWLTHACVNVGHGGYCKFFVDLVQWRATGGAKGYLPPNGSATGSINYVQPSDIIQKNAGTDHTAIVIAILARDSRGRVTAVDVIDANYIGTTRTKNRYIIARHPISGSTFQQYRTYH